MSKLSVVIIRSNSLLLDPRVYKEMRSLSKHGYNVIVLAWDRDDVLPSLEEKEGIKIKRFKLRAPYGKTSLIMFFSAFWLFVLINLFELKPKVVHACDLDTAIPAYVYKLIVRKVAFIFDVFDRYAMAYVSPKHNLRYRMVDFLEEILASKADCLIVVSESLLDTFVRFRIKYSIIIMNCPEKRTFSLPDRDRQNGMEFSLFFAGNISKRTIKNILQILRAIKGQHRTQIILLGRTLDHSFDFIRSHPQVKYLGHRPYPEALQLYNIVDVVITLYDPSIPQNRVAYPNKLFEAMMFGKPVITNVAVDIVSEAQCGVVVNYESLKNIRDAIVFLEKHPEKCYRMGQNGHSFFETKYNWDVMEYRLIDGYSFLLERLEKNLKTFDEEKRIYDSQ